jgi:outer membrane protein OmpA-like peptidoglycan-associated protein
MTLKSMLLPRKFTPTEEGHWIPLSDLMTGLMMVFMLVAIIFMLHVEGEAKKSKEQARQAEGEANLVKSIALVYDQMRLQLYNDLYSEFQNDLPVWRAVLLKDLTVRFQEPKVLFASGDDRLKADFIAILDNFFPRYVTILASQKYKEAIEEIRIEGHTSSIWENVPPEQAYFKNMQLSQSRTRTVLEYVLGIQKVNGHQTWLKSHLTANGLSSSKLIIRDGREDKQASQRVEFRVKTNADERIAEILRAVPR